MPVSERARSVVRRADDPRTAGVAGALEVRSRRLPVAEHPLINQLGRQASETELGGKLAHALADRLRITRAEASRRIHEAADLGERTAITGEPLEPVLPATAAAQRAGDLGAAHVAVIRGFVHRLPGFVDMETRAMAETQLARLGAQHRPDELSKLADKLTDCLNPDGNFTDDDRARRRGITIGKQGVDGMSPITGWLTPEARATLDAVLAKLAAPGMCNPADCEPMHRRQPTQAAIQGDTRSCAQRNHDALQCGTSCPAGLRRAGSAQRFAGQHHRHHHPARTGSRCRQSAHRRRPLLPMSDVIRHGQPRPSLPGHLRQRPRSRSTTPNDWPPLPNESCSTPRIAGARIRAVRCPATGAKSTTARHGGKCHTTDVNDLTFGCSGHHPLAEQGWTTRKRPTASPNGSHHHTSTTASPAPIPTVTPKNSCGTTTKTRMDRSRRLSS